MEDYLTLFQTIRKSPSGYKNILIQDAELSIKATHYLKLSESM